MLNASAAEMAQIPFMYASVSRRDESILQIGCKPTNNDADGHVISRRTPFDDRSTNAIVPAQRALRRKVRAPGAKRHEAADIYAPFPGLAD
jgi:hypothetical protein